MVNGALHRIAHVERAYHSELLYYQQLLDEQYPMSYEKEEELHAEYMQAVDRLKVSMWLKFIAYDVVYVSGPDSARIINSAITEYNQAEEQERRMYTDSGDNGSKHVPTDKEEGKRSSSTSCVQEGGSIIHLPLSVRRRVLSKVLEVRYGRVEIIQHKEVISQSSHIRREALEAYFDHAMLEGQEGLVIKQLTSPYVIGPSSRATNHWMKMKPDYANLTSDMDMLILGASYGHVWNQYGFLMGVKDDLDPTKFHTVCVAGTGLKQEAFNTLRDLLQNQNAAIDPSDMADFSRPPHLKHWVKCNKADLPQVYYHPP